MGHCECTPGLSFLVPAATLFPEVRGFVGSNVQDDVILTQGEGGTRSRTSALVNVVKGSMALWSSSMLSTIGEANLVVAAGLFPPSTARLLCTPRSSVDASCFRDCRAGGAD